MENKTTKNTKNAKVVKTASTTKNVAKKVEKVAKEKKASPKSKEVAKKEVKTKVAAKAVAKTVAKATKKNVKVAKDVLINSCYGVFSDKGKLINVHKKASDAVAAKKYLSDCVKKLALNTKKGDGQVYCLAANMKKGNTKQVGCAAFRKDLEEEFKAAKLNPGVYVKGDVQKFEISKINYKIM